MMRKLDAWLRTRTMWTLTLPLPVSHTFATNNVFFIPGFVFCDCVRKFTVNMLYTVLYVYQRRNLKANYKCIIQLRVWKDTIKTKSKCTIYIVRKMLCSILPSHSHNHAMHACDLSDIVIYLKKLESLCVEWLHALKRKLATGVPVMGWEGKYW